MFVVATAAKRLWDHYGVFCPTEKLSQILSHSCEAVVTDGLYLAGEYGDERSLALLSDFVEHLQEPVNFVVIAGLVEALCNTKATTSCALLQRLLRFKTLDADARKYVEQTESFVREIVARGRRGLRGTLSATKTVFLVRPLKDARMLNDQGRIKEIVAQLEFSWDAAVPALGADDAAWSIGFLDGESRPIMSWHVPAGRDLSLPAFLGEDAATLVSARNIGKACSSLTPRRTK